MFLYYSKPEGSLPPPNLSRWPGISGEAPPFRSVVVREEEDRYRPGPPRPISEKLLKCLWFDKRFSQPLKTLDGKKITLLSPGWWNKSAGPDFLNATFEDEGGRILKGNVELHVYKKDWKRHGHAEDKNYQGLALHVFFHNDGGLEDISPALQVEIAPFLSGTLEELRAEVDPNAYPMGSDSVWGGCCSLLREEAPERVASLLETAGEERLREKSEDFLKRLGPGGFDQLMYEGLMEALGYAQNGRAFLDLARKLPWEFLRKHRRRLSPEDGFWTTHALLVTTSNLAPRGRENKDPLSSKAWTHSGKGEAGEQWNLAGCRPFNHPRVRMAGAAVLMERFVEQGPFRFFRDKISGATAAEGGPWKKINRELVHLLTADAPRNFRPSFGTTTGENRRPRKLIGRGRAAVILVNAVFPILQAAAVLSGDMILEEKIRALYFHFPLLPENGIQRFMNTYLLGERYQRSPLVTSALRQQGLLHFYKKFCAANDKGCLDCGFLPFFL